MKEENLEEKKKKAHEGIIYQAQQNFEIFVAKLTGTQVVKKRDGQADIEKVVIRRKRSKKTKRNSPTG